MYSNREDIEANQNLTSSENVLKVASTKNETALLVGRVLRDQKVRDYVIDQMKEVGEGDIVSMAYLTGKGKGLRKNEIKKFKEKQALGKSNDKNLFSKAILDEFQSNKDDYEFLQKALNEKNARNETNRVPPDDLATSLSYDQQLYMPYNETYGASYIPARYYTSEEQLDGSSTNSGYYFNGYNEYYIDNMDNDFIDSKPSFIISQIDQCDIDGGVCNSVLLNPVAVAPTMPTPSSQGVWLKYNAVPDSVEENDILTTRIPMIRIKGKSWLGFGAHYQKLIFYRGAYDKATLVQNADGSVSARGLSEKLGEFRTARKNVKRTGDDAPWLTFDKQFDPNWNLSEISQQMIIFSDHTFSSSASWEGQVKFGVSSDGKKLNPTPTGSANLTGTVNITTGSAKFRANSEMNRSQMLTTIVGPASTGRVYTENDNTSYNVKSIGIVEYYMKFWFQDNL